MGIGEPLTCGLLLTLALFFQNVLGQDIDEIIQGCAPEIESGNTPNASIVNQGDSHLFFECIEDQISKYPRRLKNRLYKKITKHPAFQSVKEECIASSPEINACDPDSLYRTYDGSCNNLKHPTWGSVGECIRRFLEIYYEGASGIRLSVTGRPLPLPRDLTVNICNGPVRPSKKYSSLLVMFSQFVTHDITLSIRTAGANTIQCCPPSPDMDERCMPILIRSDDPFYSKYNQKCIPLFRTDPCRICSYGKRQQPNTVTSAIDASGVYGLSKAAADLLRAFDGIGSLSDVKTNIGKLLPANKNPNIPFCPTDRTTSCFASGDIRINQHSALMSMHTLFMREHNRIVKILNKINPHWNEERLYQEGRRIIGALVQAIVYKELLHLLLGPKLMDGYRLRVGHDISPRGGTIYNPNVKFGMWAEFSTAAFRIHNVVNSQTGLFNLTFKDLYSNTNIIHSGRMDELLSGLSETPSIKFGKDFVKDVSGFMYLAPGASSGADLPSSDISRGRDHGLPPYIRVLDFCFNGNLKIKKFSDLKRIMSQENIQLLRENYEDVRDIDAWLGMQMEKTVYDGLLGPTAACVMAKQFYSLKYGDRFYFQHEGETTSFTTAQRRTLMETTLSRIICDNTEICEMQVNAQLLPSRHNPIIPCSDHGTLDLNAWKE